ncbi:ABC-type uncharacterized transport system periplasmic component-like protein [Candidatus Vecturithrix granuli]|uniref:ABC-type uncharacterized transport system periplasmic component-like protein n=1 Tax=Vecturithrix granuli TaxID=1499967 RepID=A0A081BV14_VECG1|nr:ABC-type uncharacterized transport system periplasmic component-like protein [Candidatus Vecturithrix granuli]
MKLKWYRAWVGIGVWFIVMGGFFVRSGETAMYKVMVVMSYDETYPWVQEMKEGIESVLANTAELTYFFMDTQHHPEQGPEKAEKAFALYQQLQPDGVIAADDNAQSMFVVPYLKDKVKTPVMFCGVNAEPEQYGFPATNVSGVLERFHTRESIILAKQLVPSIETFGYILRESASAGLVQLQIEQEAESYLAKYTAFKTPATLKEMMADLEELREQCDLLFVETLSGLLDDQGKSLTDQELIPLILKNFGKPTAGNNAYHVKNGLLCAVIKMGQEQGETAANMLLQAMRGTPISQLPITKNTRGKRLLNVDTMKALDIKPKPHILKGIELITTSE